MALAAYSIIALGVLGISLNPKQGALTGIVLAERIQWTVIEL